MGDSVADPDPESVAFLDLGSGMEKIRIWDEHPSFFRELSNNFLGIQYVNS